MGQVLEGFATLAFIVVVGVLLAHRGILGRESERTLNRLAFAVALPALMITMLAEADLAALFSANLATAITCAAVAALAYVVASRWLWPGLDTGSRTIGTLTASYTNSGNLGIPIASFVLGSPTWVVPTLLMQTLIFQPVALAVLDSATTGAQRWRDRLLTPLRNPITLGGIVGLLLAATNTTLPPAIHSPIEMLGQMCVPLMVLAFGSSLRTGPRIGAAEVREQLALSVLIKLIVMPLVAYAVGRFAFGLADLELLAVVVAASLPSAQNIAVHASRYQRAEVLARDAIFISTGLSVPVILAVVAVLG